MVLSGGLRRRSVSSIIWVVGQIQFIVIAVLRSPFPLWLSTESHSQLLGVSPTPFSFTSGLLLPSLKPATVGQVPFAFEISPPPPIPSL